MTVTGTALGRAGPITPVLAKPRRSGGRSGRCLGKCQRAEQQAADQRAIETFLIIASPVIGQSGAAWPLSGMLPNTVGATEYCAS